jgi:hypothetical protein
MKMNSKRLETKLNKLGYSLSKNGDFWVIKAGSDYPAFARYCVDLAAVQAFITDEQAMKIYRSGRSIPA